MCFTTPICHSRYVYCRECDLSSLSSVRKFVSEFREKETRLDGLVNNAGIMNHPRKYSPDGVELHLATNFLGHFLLTDLLLGMLRDRSSRGGAPARLIYLMNPDYRKSNASELFVDLNSTEKWDASEAFRKSQLANMLLVQHLARAVLDPADATANAVYPGVVATDIKRHMGVDKSIVGTFISSPLLWLLTTSPERGAQTAVYAAIDESAAGASGKLYVKREVTEPEVTADSEKAAEEAARKVYALGKYWSGQEQDSEALKKIVGS